MDVAPGPPRRRQASAVGFAQGPAPLFSLAGLPRRTAPADIVGDHAAGRWNRSDVVLFRLRPASAARLARLLIGARTGAGNCLRAARGQASPGAEAPTLQKPRQPRCRSATPCTPVQRSRSRSIEENNAIIANSLHQGHLLPIEPGAVDLTEYEIRCADRRQHRQSGPTSRTDPAPERQGAKKVLLTAPSRTTASRTSSTASTTARSRTATWSSGRLRARPTPSPGAEALNDKYRHRERPRRDRCTPYTSEPEPDRPATTGPIAAARCARSNMSRHLSRCRRVSPRALPELKSEADRSAIRVPTPANVSMAILSLNLRSKSPGRHQRGPARVTALLNSLSGQIGYTASTGLVSTDVSSWLRATPASSTRRRRRRRQARRALIRGADNRVRLRLPESCA